MTRIASPETSAPVDAAAGAKPSEQAPTATATRRKSLSASSRGSGSVAGAAATESTAGKRGSAIAAAYGISTPSQPEQADKSDFQTAGGSADTAFSDADGSTFETSSEASQEFQGGHGQVDSSTSLSGAQAQISQQEESVADDISLQEAFQEVAAEARSSPFPTENYAPAFHSVITMTGTVSSAPKIVPMRSGADLVKFMLRVRRPGTSMIDSCAPQWFLYR